MGIPRSRFIMGIIRLNVWVMRLISLLTKSSRPSK